MKVIEIIIAVTNRLAGNFALVKRVEEIARAEFKPCGIILREKDLPEPEYESLAVKLKPICRLNGIQLIINTHYRIAQRLHVSSVQLPYSIFKENTGALGEFPTVMVSVHSQEEAIMAQRLGASHLIAGHIFATDSKKGVAPRGLDFLKEICDTVTIPVFAIGGINRNNVGTVFQKGARGICLMSELMLTADPSSCLKEYQKRIHSQDIISDGFR